MIKVRKKETDYIYNLKNFDDLGFTTKIYHDSINAIHTERDLLKPHEPDHVENIFDWVENLKEYNEEE